MRAFGKRGAFEDISKFYTDQNLKDVMGPFLPAVTDGGKQYMMPTNFTTWGFFYNKESFERVGVAPRDDSGKVRRTMLRDERAAWIKENRAFRIMPARASTKSE